jgi:hypothetical protein
MAENVKQVTKRKTFSYNDGTIIKDITVFEGGKDKKPIKKTKEVTIDKAKKVSQKERKVVSMLDEKEYLYGNGNIIIQSRTFSYTDGKDKTLTSELTKTIKDYDVSEADSAEA